MIEIKNNQVIKMMEKILVLCWGINCVLIFLLLCNGKVDGAIVFFMVNFFLAVTIIALWNMFLRYQVTLFHDRIRIRQGKKEKEYLYKDINFQTKTFDGMIKGGISKSNEMVKYVHIFVNNKKVGHFSNRCLGYEEAIQRLNSIEN